MNQSAAKRSLLVLEHLAGRPDGLGLLEIAAAVALPKSAAHRLLALLTETEFVRQDAASGRYALTLKLTMLGLRHYVRSGIDDLAQPLLDRLAAATGELARLAIVDSERLVWIAKAQGARAGLRYDPGTDHDTGQNVVLHATATGKAWLSTLPEADALRIVRSAGFRTPDRFGPHAARDIADFRTRLQKTRSDGYGEAVEEGEPGTAAVAVAVRDRGLPAGPAVATLSLAGPLVRFGAERRAALAGQLRAAAEDLGAIWPLRRSTATGVDTGRRAAAPTGGTEDDIRSLATL